MSNIVRLNPGYFPNPTTDKSLSNASIYVGEPDTDPTVPANQKTISVLQENGTTVAVPQPITTSAGGVPQYNGFPVTVLVDGNYSIAVLDSNDVQVFYVPSQPESLVQNVKYVDSLSDLKANSGTYDGETVYLTGRASLNDGGQGHFIWIEGDYTTQVTADTLSGVYAPSDDDSDGSEGCWVRPHSSLIDIQWFGAIRGGFSDCTAAVQACVDFCRGSTTTDNLVVDWPYGRWLITDELNVGPGTKIKGVNGDAGGVWGATAAYTGQLSDSKGTVILHQPTSEKDLFVPSLPKGGSNAYSGISIEGLNIWGVTTPDSYHRTSLGLSDVTYSRYAFNWDYVHYSTVKNVAVFGFQSGVYLGSYTQRNLFDNVQISHCRNACVTYGEYVTAFPTSDIWSNCVFRTADMAFEQKGATTGSSYQIRLVECQIEDIASYGFLLPRGARNWEVAFCYGESIGIDTGVADRGVFNIGGFGSDALPNEVNLSIIGGQYIGSNTNNFIMTDETTMVFITNTDAKNFGTLITATASTRDYGIHITGLGHYSTGTFYSGPNNKLYGDYRSVGLDVGTNIVTHVGQFYGNSNATYTQMLGGSIRLGDGSTSSVNPGANASIDLGIAGVLEWDNLFIVNAPTVSSDRRVKCDIDVLSNAEKAVALKLKPLIRKFRIISDVGRNGSDAKIHVGVIAQDVVQSFKDEGLNALNYNVVSYENDKYAIRYEELIMFILSSI